MFPIHLEATEDLFVRVFDVIAQKEALQRTLQKQGDVFYVNVASDGTGHGHIIWDSVTPRDSTGNCRCGHDDRLVDDSSVYYIDATSNAPGHLPCV